MWSAKSQLRGYNLNTPLLCYTVLVISLFLKETYRPDYSSLRTTSTILAKTETELLNALQKCLTDLNYAENIAKNGQKIIQKNQGATQKTIRQIDAIREAVSGRFQR